MIRIIATIAVLVALGKAIEYVFAKLDKATSSGTQQPTPAQLEQQHGQDYMHYFSAVVKPCMKANSDALRLETPGDYAQHDPGAGNRISKTGNGQVVFRYVFRRTSLVSGGIEHTKLSYSTLPAKDMTNYLKAVLNNYAVAGGFPPASLVVKDRGAGQVVLSILFQ